MPSHASHRTDHASQVVKDPVCGMEVDLAQTAFAAEHEGETFYFCSAHCKARFDADPGSFVHPRTGAAGYGLAHEGYAAASSAAASEPATAEGVSEWTCPMHPEIRRSAPGSCPICGMGAGAGDGHGRFRSEPRTGGHDAPVLGRGRAVDPGSRPRHGRRPDPGDPRCPLPEGVRVDPTRAGHAGGVVGGLAVLRAWLDLGPDHETEHVHADRDGHRRRPGCSA